MRILWAVLAWSRVAMATSDWDRAAVLAERWRTGHIDAGALGLAAGAIPWPLVPVDVERAVAGQLVTGDLNPPWASDRLLPVLAGELPASGELLDTMLLAIARTSSTTLEGLAVARRAYAQGRPTEAVAQYRRLEGTGELWREAAWAHYAAGDDARALGTGVTLAAPWLPSEDHAEGRLSTAMVMRDHCRFDEARQLVAPLVQLVLIEPPGNLLALLLEETDSSDPLVREVRTAPLVRRLREVLTATPPPETTQGESLRQSSRERLAAMVQRAWDAAVEARRSIAERALALRYDTLRAERSLRAGGWTPEHTSVADPPPVADDEIVWAFHGRYWRDELGLYRSLAVDACPRERR